MTTPPHNPTQRQFVHRLIDWERVESRLKLYPAIKRAFPVETLKHRCESKPYYCHYMAWRLGTWENESLFQRLEELLCCAEALPNWEQEKSLLSSADFADFWSLVWQLQVAEHLCGVGTDVRWANSGPDLSVKIDNKRWYAECYTPRKSFGLLEFLREILETIDPDVHTYYDRCLPFQLPQNSDRTHFLDEVLSRSLDPVCLTNAKKAAETEYPVVLYEHPGSSLYIYVEGDNCDAYMPCILPNRTGDPKSYIECILREAVNAKKDSNDLKNHHPNLLAVNYVLSEGFQVAGALPERVKSRTLPQIDPNIDALAVSAVGIDERLTREKLKVQVVSEGNACSFLDQIASCCLVP